MPPQLTPLEIKTAKATYKNEQQNCHSSTARGKDVGFLFKALKPSVISDTAEKAKRLLIL
jgi:hypothetical protein